ncbi:MAG: hypothetical protein GY866_34695, partial [Proteobacteria bacterium]|nr:hypothetical protein [Pseudomonadota bacterium]
MKDERGYTTSFIYDAIGRILRVDYPDGGRKTVQYDYSEFPYKVITKIKETDNSEVESVAWFDGLNRRCQIMTYGENQARIFSRTLRDPMGRVGAEQGPYFSASENPFAAPPEDHYSVVKTFDYRGRPTEIVRSGNEITKMDFTGFSTKTTDPENSVKVTARDYLGRITRVDEDLGGGRTYYSYNVAGNLTLIIDAKNNRTAFNWDTLGRKIFMFDDVLGNWIYKYDVSGNLIEVIDPRPDKTNEELANSVKYERDEMGRVVRETREIDLVPGLHTI